MHARSAVVDLFGDHLRSHGWWAPVAGLVTLGQACGVQPAATRTAVSRLVREGWLTGVTRDGTRGYAATDLAQERLRVTYGRVYASGEDGWDGRWHLVIVDHGGQRRRRDQVAASLGFLGYGRLAPGTWLSPRPSPELATTLAAHGATWTALTAELDPVSSELGDPAALAARLWDLRTLEEDYRAFLADLPARPGLEDLAPESAYPLRAELVHRWRNFLFQDPGLPPRVLAPDWPGRAARDGFLAVASVLRPAAETFVARTVLAETSGRPA